MDVMIATYRFHDPNKLYNVEIKIPFTRYWRFVEQSPAEYFDEIRWVATAYKRTYRIIDPDTGRIMERMDGRAA